MDYLRRFSLGTCAHSNNLYRESGSETQGVQTVPFVVVAAGFSWLLPQDAHGIRLTRNDFHPFMNSVIISRGLHTIWKLGLVCVKVIATKFIKPSLLARRLYNKSPFLYVPKLIRWWYRIVWNYFRINGLIAFNLKFLALIL